MTYTPETIMDDLAGTYLGYFDTSINLIMGDVDYDGVLSAKDESVIKKVISGVASVSSLQNFLIDLNSDGTITAADLYMFKLLMTN